MPRQARTAVLPGTFDPLTRGHLDIIRRAATLFDAVIVAVGNNPDKPALFDQAARAELASRSVSDLTNVRVETYTGLTVDFALQAGGDVLLRGLRNSSDLDAEFQTAETNRTVSGVDTVFLMTGADCAFISSSLVRQIAAGGGDVSGLVPPASLEALRDRFAAGG
ncbi:MAG: pantetheine-phosphate adenylyltransferase [Planctomycetota bacterium]